MKVVKIISFSIEKTLLFTLCLFFRNKGSVLLVYNYWLKDKHRIMIATLCQYQTSSKQHFPLYWKNKKKIKQEYVYHICIKHRDWSGLHSSSCDLKFFHSPLILNSQFVIFLLLHIGEFCHQLKFLLWEPRVSCLRINGLESKVSEKKKEKEVTIERKLLKDVHN